MLSRYHKYTLCAELRNKTRAVLEKIIEANNTPDRTEHLMGLRHQLENLKVLCRQCH
jgi:5-methylcytosine-specific restriction endonuclease McrA